MDGEAEEKGAERVPLLDAALGLDDGPVGEEEGGVRAVTGGSPGIKRWEEGIGFTQKCVPRNRIKGVSQINRNDILRWRVR